MAVQRILIRCDVCDETTLLRMQVGSLEVMPIAIGCNECGIVLKGCYLIDNVEVKTTLELTNATIIDEIEGVHGQEIECSGEFPTRRFISGVGDFRLSPFMNAIQFMPEGRYEDFIGRLNSFTKEWKANNGRLHDSLKLYKNNKFELILNIALSR